MSDQRYPRGTAYHEAGHAVVAWSFGLHVGAISVVAEDARGEAQIGSAKHLSLVEQIALYSAGYVAENTFGHPAHRLAAASDHNRIRELLEANRVEEGPKTEALRSEAAGCARERLLAHKAKVIRLAERLVQDGCVDAAEFLRLIR
jgi:hypothetical protein